MMLSHGSRPANVLNLPTFSVNEYPWSRERNETTIKLKTHSNGSLCKLLPCHRARPQRRFSLCRSDKLVGIDHVAAADFEAMEHSKAIKGVFEPGRPKFELTGAVSNEGT